MKVREFLRQKLLNAAWAKKVGVAACAEAELLPAALVRMPSMQLRRLFGLPSCEHASQLNQDFFALIFNRFRSEYFVEIGANDGFTLSNTVYLEACFKWDGLLIEANPQYAESLGRRRARALNVAITAAEGEFKFVAAGLYGGLSESLGSAYKHYTSSAPTIVVRGARLETVLRESNAPSVIGFVSVDVEGSEPDIVKQICELPGYRFNTGCIEHNYRISDLNAMKNMLSAAGYRVVWDGMTQHDLFFVDERRVG
jgi:FkbM family methyltransferase